MCLGLYFLALSMNRLTTIISLFATTQPLDTAFDDGSVQPKVAILICCMQYSNIPG